MKKDRQVYWSNYVSELCSGSMLAKEEKLEKQIRQLKEYVS